MRVLHFHDAPQILGGATVYLRRLVEEMAVRGHENHLFRLDGAATSLTTASEHGFVYDDPGSAWRRRRDYHDHCPALAVALARAVQEVGAEVIHVQNCAVFRRTVFPALAATGVPVLMTVHDFSLDDPNPTGQPRAGLGGLVRSWLDRRSQVAAKRAVLDAVRLFLCPTEALLRGLQLPADRARVLRLPIDEAEEAPLPAPEPPRLFFAGTLYRSKGVDLLLAALTRCTGAGREAVLEIAGSGDQHEPLEKQVQELGLEPRVRFLGPLDAAGMDAAYARSHLQLLPSRVPENSPLTVLEAGARGRPAIAADGGGVPELLPRERGWTFPNEDVDALARILDEACGDPAERSRRAERMRSWVRSEFAPDRHWEAVESAWQEVRG